jgi:hypothetical protein
MSQSEVLGVHLPELPKLDQEDVKAVRSFLPGKLLGRTAALLSLALLVLGFAGLVDQGLQRLLAVDLSAQPWLRFGLLLGLPLLAVSSQLAVEWRAEHGRRVLQKLAVQPGAEQSGYFRIGPYLNAAEDRVRFDRADRAHEKVLAWIERSAGVPLYLTGDSGSGKSSLLNAFVLPTLRERGWTVVEARAWQDPETALREALAQLPGPRRPRQGESPDLRALIDGVARRAGSGVLLVLDQFEEFVILGKQEQQQKFAALLGDLRATPIQGLCLLLVLRSDYQTFLDDMGLPPLRYGENFYQVGRFTIAAATGFMARSGLELQPDAVDRLVTSAAELDETPGLVRPITLNVIGYVLATGKPVASTLDAGQLVRRYIELTVGQPVIRDFAPRVLEHLVTEQGTKRPRSEQELACSTNFRRGEVRAVLNGLSAAALARPLDPAQGVWELSHDFVARAVGRYLGRRRHTLSRRTISYAAPALLATGTLLGFGMIAWNQLSLYQLRYELSELGFAITPGNRGPVASTSSQFKIEHLAEAGPLLARFSALRALDLESKGVEGLDPLQNLTGLQWLNLTGNFLVYNLDPIESLTALQVLGLGNTGVESLEPLKHLTVLQWLDLGGTKVGNLEPLRGLTALQTLRLNATKVENLEPLKGLTALQGLDLYATKVENLEPLRGLTALLTLNLGGTEIENLEPLKGLTALQTLDLSYTKIESLEPLIGLPALQLLYLSDSVSEVERVRLNHLRQDQGLQPVGIMPGLPPPLIPGPGRPR